MKIQVLSDLHLDTWRGQRPFSLADADLLILAGDIAEVSRYPMLRHFLEDVTQKFENVVWLAGNHEYYCGDFFEVINLMYEFEDTYDNLHVLNPGIFITDDIIFVGATYWTDFNGNDVRTQQEVYRSLNDYRVIRFKDSTISPKDIYHEHELDRYFISETVKQSAFKDMRKIVITHHSPSFKSVDPKYYSTGLMNYGFVSNHDSFVEELGEKYNVTHWIHGHTHNENDYFIGKVLVLSNPRGYPRERIEYKELVLEV